MKPEVRTAFVAANAVTAAVRAAEAAVNLLEQVPRAWGLADVPYWLCRSAQEAAQNAADELDPEEALEDDMILYAFRTAMEAVEKACTVADELVSLAEAAGHEIRR